MAFITDISAFRLSIVSLLISFCRRDITLISWFIFFGTMPKLALVIMIKELQMTE